MRLLGRRELQTVTELGKSMERRSFLRNVAAGSAGASLVTLTSARAAGANNRVRVGLIGCGVRGRYVAERMAKVKDTEIVVGADVYDEKFGRLRNVIGEKCETVRDFRRILDRKDIDAVIVATPDHWHSIPTILACRQEKDVYVEKPLAHTIAEGRAMVSAARTHKRVVQTGVQQRSAAHFSTIRELIADRPDWQCAVRSHLELQEHVARKTGAKRR